MRNLEWSVHCNEDLLQVDPSIVVRACIRPPVFSLPCLYQIFCFGVIHAPHFSSSPSYNVQAPVLFIRRILSLPCLYHQIFCFGVIHAPHCSSSFSYNVRAPVFFTRRIYDSSIHALHPVSPFMYQPGFIHSCAASCLSFHGSARLHSFMHCILPLLVCISHEAWSLPDLSFSLTCIKTGTQLYVQEIRADGYKTPRWPIRSLFSLVHIA